MSQKLKKEVLIITVERIVLKLDYLVCKKWDQSIDFFFLIGQKGRFDYDSANPNKPTKPKITGFGTKKQNKRK